MLASMDDLHLGLALRAVRIRRRLRQCDLAAQGGVSASLVSRLEHGDLDRVSLRTVRRVAAKLGVSLEMVVRSAGGELDRVVNARHAALGESVAAWIARQPGWIVAAEVSFAIYGERGLIDLLVWHESTGSLVLIELKTAIVDVNELIGTLDRKRRLAARIAAGRGWAARSVSAWLIVANSSTNRRRIADHRILLTSGLPRDGRSLAPLFLRPERGPESGIAFWSILPGVRVSHPIAALERVVKRRKAASAPASRLGAGAELPVSVR
jgi:transcriptional regulator with XRE-family HTH domain